MLTSLDAGLLGRMEGKAPELVVASNLCSVTPNLSSTGLAPDATSMTIPPDRDGSRLREKCIRRKAQRPRGPCACGGGV